MVSLDLAQGDYFIELVAQGYLNRIVEINTYDKTDFTVYMVNALETDKVLVLLEWSDVNKNLDLIIKSEKDVLSEKHKQDILGNKLWTKNGISCEIARLNINSIGNKQEIIVNNAEQEYCTVSILGNGEIDISETTYNKKDNMDAWKVASIQYLSVIEINENIASIESLPSDNVEKSEFVSGSVTGYTSNGDGIHITETKSYYSDDKCIEEVVYKVEDESVIGRTLYEYNDVGGLLRTVVYNENNEVESEKVNEYDKRFNIVKQEDIIKGNGISYKYDEYGNVIEYYTFDKETPYYYKYELKYNEKHLCNGISEYFKDNEEPIGYRAFCYDSQGNCVINSTLDSDHGYLDFAEYAYDSQGNEICCYVSDYFDEYNIWQKYYDNLGEHKAETCFGNSISGKLYIYDNKK